MDRWYDNHYAYVRDDMSDAKLAGIVTNLTDAGTGFHCTSDGVFVWEPTGDAIFVARADGASAASGAENDDGDTIADVLSVCWNHGVDAADLCSQGYCTGELSNLTANASECTGESLRTRCNERRDGSYHPGH